MKPERHLRRTEIPFDVIYWQHGSLLFEQKRYLESKEILEKALRWNPSSVKIILEYMETYKVLGEIETFFNLAKESFKYAFRAEYIARCYRNLGYYFIEKGLWKEASGCYLLSLQFEEDNKTALSELGYIQSEAPEGFTKPTFDDIKKYLEEYDLPLGADAGVIEMAYAQGASFFEKGEKEGVLYCLHIVYELTDDTAIKEIIDDLKA